MDSRQIPIRTAQTTLSHRLVLARTVFRSALAMAVRVFWEYRVLHTNSITALLHPAILM